MQSNGGIIAAGEASAYPCRIVESGPAAGVISAAYFGTLLGRKNIIAFDMGGTTAKAGLIENGEVRLAAGRRSAPALIRRACCGAVAISSERPPSILRRSGQAAVRSFASTKVVC
jgi:Hydantoinase/oxoprolinase